MSQITRTYTFTDGTTAYGSQVDSEVQNIVTNWNNHDSGTSSWTVLKGVTLNITGVATLGSTLAVSGAATLSSTLAVTGVATFNPGSNQALRINNQTFASAGGVLEFARALDGSFPGAIGFGAESNSDSVLASSVSGSYLRLGGNTSIGFYIGETLSNLFANSRPSSTLRMLLTTSGLTLSDPNDESLVLSVSNTSNTSSAFAQGQFKVAGSTAQDPYIQFRITSITDWSLGIDNSDSDRFKISQNGTLGTNDYLIIDKTTTGVSQTGTNTNDSAASGYVGEYIVSTVTSPSNIASTGTFGNITSITLSAGDWDVVGQTAFDYNSASVSSAFATAISINTGNTTTDHVDGVNVLYGAGPAQTANRVGSSTVVYRMSLSGSTTVYLKCSAAYTGGPPKALGTIYARRRR